MRFTVHTPGYAVLAGLLLAALTLAFSVPAATPTTAQAALASSPMQNEAICTPIEPVSLSNPQVVGTGSAASCTRQALQSALDSGGQISFDCGGAATIALDAELVVSQDTVLDGGGLVTLDGQNSTRVINKQDGANLTIQNITIQNGKAPGPNGHFSNETGGGILARGQGTTLTVINSTFQNNTVTSIDGSDIAGGAIYAFGLYEAVISGSTFTGNTASNGGAIGGLASGIRIYNSTFTNNEARGQSGGLRGHGGAINMDGVTNSQNPDSNKLYHICGSTFSGNKAYTQGGASNSVFSDNKGSKAIIEKSSFLNNQTTSPDAGQGGAIFHMEDEHAGGSNEDNFDILHSTFAGNSAFRQGGAVWTLIEGNVRVENSTFANNRTEDQALGMGGGIAINRGNVTFTNVTFSKNYAWFHGGGIQAGGDGTIITLKNTLFYRNESVREWADYQINRPADVDGGGNLQFPAERFNQDGTPNDDKATETVIIADPMLAELADNGGPNQTIALQEGSAAIDAGTSSGCPATDQRGAARPHGQGCDIGAYEFGATIDDPTPEPEPTPEVSITHGSSGGLGSIFVISGSNLPTTPQTLNVVVNGVTLDGTVSVDAAGSVVFLLDTSNISQPGSYQVSIMSEPALQVQFVLTESGEVLTAPPEFADAQTLVVPQQTTPITMRSLYLPLVIR